jgi:hypothetical protein
MAKTQKTPRPQKSSAKDQAEVNITKGTATTAPPPSDESDEAKVEVETVVGDHPEAEQKNQSARKADDISGVDDAVAGIQSIMEASSAVVSLPGAATMITAAPANDPKKSKAKKPSPSKRKMPATKMKKYGSQVMTRYFGYIFLNSAGTRLIMAQPVFPGQKMVHLMYLQIGYIVSGRGTKIMYYWLPTRVS